MRVDRGPFALLPALALLLQLSDVLLHRSFPGPEGLYLQVLGEYFLFQGGLLFLEAGEAHLLLLDHLLRAPVHFPFHPLALLLDAPALQLVLVGKELLEAILLDVVDAA